MLTLECIYALLNYIAEILSENHTIGEFLDNAKNNCNVMLCNLKTEEQEQVFTEYKNIIKCFTLITKNVII